MFMTHLMDFGQHQKPLGGVRIEVSGLNQMHACSLPIGLRQQHRAHSQMSFSHRVIKRHGVRSCIQSRV